MGRSLPALIGTLLVVLLAGCSVDREPPDIDSAATFQRFPIYWLGEEFEGLELTHVEAEDWSTAATLTYGTCKPSGYDGGCAPPVQVQVFPLCYHLDSVWLPPNERELMIRGAPVGRQDGAPVLLTRRVQVKVYRGVGTDDDPGVSLRALKALRSLNSVSPVISASDPIPPPAQGVLEGDRPCAG
jgi:hypothetical protein